MEEVDEIRSASDRPVGSGRSVLVGEHVGSTDFQSGVRLRSAGAIRRLLDCFSLTKDELEQLSTFAVIGMLFGMAVMSAYFFFNELLVLK